MAKSTKTPEPKKSGSCLVPCLIVLLVFLVGLGAGGYFFFTKVRGFIANTPLAELADKVTGGAMMQLVSESDLMDISDPLIRKHLLKQYNTRKYRVVSTSDGLGNGGHTEMTLDMRSTADFRVRVAQVVDGKEVSDMITIGDTTYLKDPKDGAWWMQTAKPDTTKNTEEKTDFSPEAMKEEALKKDRTTYKNLGEEACGSLTCHKYEEMTGEDSGKRTFWFDTNDLLLRREENGYGEFTSKSEYFYDNVSVEAPSPTKPVPEGKSIYEMSAQGLMQGSASAGYGGGNSAPSEQQIENMMQQFGAGSGDSAPTDEPVDSGQ